jgi:hypothetical protein
MNPEHIVNAKAPTEHYSVGFGRPPKEHQFKKGQSGNPSGRPRGSQTLRGVLNKVLRRQTTIRIGANEQRVSMFEALLCSALNKGIKGNVAAQKMVIGLHVQFCEEGQDVGLLVSETDAEILADYERRVREGLEAEVTISEAQQ